MSSIDRLKSGRYRVRWRDGGVPKSKSFPFRDGAETFQAELRLGVSTAAPSRERMSFRDFAARWHRDYCLVEKSDSQHIDDESLIRVHLAPAFGEVMIDKLSARELVELRGRLNTGKSLSPKRMNLITGLARKMLQTAVDWGYLDKNPFAAVRPIRLPEAQPAFWAIGERERFLRFARRREPAFAALVTFACHTGLRSGEIAGLVASQIDFERKVVVVNRKHNLKTGKTDLYTKGKRLRVVPLNAAALEAVSDRRLIAPTASVFPGFDPHHASDRLRGLTHWALVSPIRFHDLRHTFASNLAAAGVPMQHLQCLLGHSDIRQTMVYAHLMPSDLAGLTERLCVMDVLTEPRKDCKVATL